MRDTKSAKTQSASPPSVLFSQAMHERVRNVLKQLEASPPYQTLFAPDTPLPRAQEFIRNVLFETHCYGHHVTEAAFTGLGRLPKSKPQVISALCDQLVDEVFHPEIAGQDVVRFGGERATEGERISPASFAVAATARMLAERESPFCYLGFIYLLENTTPILAERVQNLLAEKKSEEVGKFIPLHAKEDIKHLELIQEISSRLVDSFPEASADIQWGFDCFASIYPIPIWKTAFDKLR